MRALLLAGVKVRALVRDTTTPAAAALAELGAALAPGGYEDLDSLKAAAHGADAVFSVQLFNPRQPENELAQARALIAASRYAGVTCFVQSSVSAVSLYRASSADDERWDRVYWQNKAEVEDAAQTAHFAALTILRPAFMMENFVSPKAAHMFPDLTSGRLRSVLLPDKPLALVAARDIGAVAAHAILFPSPNTTIELASELLMPKEIASTLSAAWDRKISAETVTDSELRASGISEGWIRMQHWMNDVGYPAKPDAISSIGIEPTRLDAWAASKRSL